jgi:hypothetical protein
MLELLRDIRGNITTKADFAAMRVDRRSFRKAMPAFGLDAHKLDRIRNARAETDAPYTLADAPEDLLTSRRIFRLALQTFGSNANVRRWLVEPGSWAIDYQMPAVLLQSPQGRKMLEDFLGRLAYGVYQ